MQTLIMLLLYLAICITIYFFVQKNISFFSFCKPTPCDERQLIARGKSYKYAFFVLLGYLTLCMLTQSGIIKAFASAYVLFVIGICIGFFAFASSSILQDAYVTPKTDPKNMAVSLGSISAVNIVVGLFLSDVVVLKNGTLEYISMNLLLGITFLLLFLLFVFKQFILLHSEEE